MISPDRLAVLVTIRRAGFWIWFAIAVETFASVWCKGPRPRPCSTGTLHAPPARKCPRGYIVPSSPGPPLLDTVVPSVCPTRARSFQTQNLESFPSSSEFPLLLPPLRLPENLWSQPRYCFCFILVAFGSRDDSMGRRSFYLPWWEHLGLSTFML